MTKISLKEVCSHITKDAISYFNIKIKALGLAEEMGQWPEDIFLRVMYKEIVGSGFTMELSGGKNQNGNLIISISEH